MHPVAAASAEGTSLFSLPHPRDPSRSVVWNGHAFEVDGQQVRVLAYSVAASGWTDQLTELHEQTGKSDHFIDIASRRHALDEVARCASAPGASVLEVGVSSGFLLREMIDLLPDRQIIGADYTAGTLQALAPRVPGIPLIQFDLTQCPLPDASVDVAVLLNVLEHIGDHKAATAHLFRIIRPGGVVIIEVPAGGKLFDVYDRVLMHHRRYDMPDLIQLMTDAGFSIERRSHLGFFLYPLFYAAKRLNQFRYPGGMAVDEEKLVAEMIVNTRKSSWIMGKVMALEQTLRSKIYYPCGIRCLVTCRKPDSNRRTG